MAITALPSATVHLLGSAQALTTPTSLVKELIDNSLDAKATSIDILISPNTIDKIEVRDNGHGIPQEDLDALGRRGYTSKLRTFDELKAIGGVTLGFRGEALASAMQLGNVTMTTKTEGEAVATIVQLKPPGGIANRSRTSHPVGTTVSVAKFLYALPVRRQVAEKEAAKTMKKVKELLQSYSLARPQVKFCLRVTKGRKRSWTFNPRPIDGMREAVSQVIGRDAASQCIEKHLRFSEKDGLAQVSIEDKLVLLDPEVILLEPEAGDFMVEVFLPKPNATCIGNGQYISVDSRPVAHDKGTMRRIVTIFKRYVKSALAESDGKIQDPFLRMNIKCPVASYDPNVEPAKDDILFGNESLVLESIEQLFKSVYGDPVASSTAAEPQMPIQEPNDLELLMSRGKVAANSTHEEAPSEDDVAGINHPPNTRASELPFKTPTSIDIADVASPATLHVEDSDEPALDLKRPWSVDMSRDYSEDVEGLHKPGYSSQRRLPESEADADAAGRARSCLNPWTIAKLTAPVRQQNGNAIPILQNRPSGRAPAAQTYLPTPQHSFDPICNDIDRTGPASSTQSRQQFARDDISLRSLPPTHSPAHVRGTISLPTNVPYRRAVTAEPDDRTLSVGDGSEIFRRRNEFNSARETPNASMSTIPSNNGSKKSRGVKKPFVPPAMTTDAAMAQDRFRPTTVIATAHPSPAQPNSCGRALTDEPGFITTWSSNPDLAWAMDFEHRKEYATRQIRQEKLVARAEAACSAQAERRQMLAEERYPRQEIDLTGDTVRSSPHKNRYNAAIASLTASQQTPCNDTEVLKPVFKTSLPDDDPRAYIMTRKKSVLADARKTGQAPKPMRSRSSRLPLESIPIEEKLHALMLTLPINMMGVRRAMSELVSSDMYVGCRDLHARLASRGSEKSDLEKMVQQTVEKWRESEAGKKYDVTYSFEKILVVE